MKNTEKYKDLLAKEKQQLEIDLDSLGHRSQATVDHWETKPEQMDTDQAEVTELADAVEAFGENTYVLKRLQERYDNVLAALKALEDGSYGLCRVCRKEIEKARLEANPAALTCIEHRDEE